MNAIKNHNEGIYIRKNEIGYLLAKFNRKSHREFDKDLIETLSKPGLSI